MSIDVTDVSWSQSCIANCIRHGLESTLSFRMRMCNMMPITTQTITNYLHNKKTKEDC